MLSILITYGKIEPSKRRKRKDCEKANLAYLKRPTLVALCSTLPFMGKQSIIDHSPDSLLGSYLPSRLIQNDAFEQRAHST